MIRRLFQRVRIFLTTIRFSTKYHRLRKFYTGWKGAIALLVLVGLSYGFFEAGRFVYARLWSSRPPMTMRIAVRSRQFLSWHEIREIARRAALRHGVDPALVQSMIAVESSYDPLALSHRGAIGLMQLMPDTAGEMGVIDPFDVHENIDGGVRYLKKLLRRYRGNLRLALAAYNAGPNSVREHRGVPPYAETRSYVQKVISRYRKLKKKGTS